MLTHASSFAVFRVPAAIQCESRTATCVLRAQIRLVEDPPCCPHPSRFVAPHPTTLLPIQSLRANAQIRLVLMIKDPREAERWRQMGFENESGCSRDEIADAFVEVRAGDGGKGRGGESAAEARREALREVGGDEGGGVLPRVKRGGAKVVGEGQGVGSRVEGGEREERGGGDGGFGWCASTCACVAYRVVLCNPASLAGCAFPFQVCEDRMPEHFMVLRLCDSCVPRHGAAADRMVLRKLAQDMREWLRLQVSHGGDKEVWGIWKAGASQRPAPEEEEG
ncbi:unnamed protein product [Closterium sp. NIES-64]|nr:unnamed protein product [Closterium sp. NIES-64]